VSGSKDETIKIWDPKNGTLKFTLNGHTGAVYALISLPNDDIVSGSIDKTVIIWTKV
jgi:WD40 repeat protein